MQIVIKIPDSKYQSILSDDYCGLLNADLYKAIKDGVPLPKGHGDLKDANALKNAFIAWSMAVHGNFTDADIASVIYNSPTIIEADREK